MALQPATPNPPARCAHPPPQVNTLAFVPRTAPCPRCGAHVERSEVRKRVLQAADLHTPTVYEVSFSCFICRSHPPKERWFTALPERLSGASRYTGATRSLLVSLVVHHKMSCHGAASFAANDQVEERERRQVEAFSGQLGVDEVYDGGRALIKATDPLRGEEVAYTLVEGTVNTKVMTSFFERLQDRGFVPEVVVTDGASFYPDAIVTVWPEARHQTCLFHFFQSWTKLALAAVMHCHSLMPAPPKRGSGRPKKRGRPRADSRKQWNRKFVKDRRYLFVKQPGNLTEDQARALEEAMSTYAALRTSASSSSPRTRSSMPPAPTRRASAERGSWKIAATACPSSAP